MVLAVAGCSSATERDTSEPFDPRAFAKLESPEAAVRPRAELEKRVTGELTLEDAQEIALAGNPGLLSNADAVDAARARIREAQSFTNPVFTFTKSDVPLSNTVEGENNIFRVRNFDLRPGQTAWGLTKDLDVSGKRVARVDVALENERQSEAQFASAAHALRAQVRVAYAQVLVAEKTVDLARESRDMAKKNLEVIGALAGGKGLLSDKLRAEAEATRSESDVAQAERALESARSCLALLLGAPGVAVGKLTSKLPLSGVPEAKNDDELVNEALQRNADVIAARRAVRSAESNLRLQNRSMIPDLTIGAQVNLYEPDRQTVTGGLSIGLPLPVFDQNRGQIAEATALLHQAEKTLSQTENAVMTAVREDVEQLRVSGARWERFEKEILPKLREAVRLTEASYEGGKILYLDVISARQAFNQAATDYVNVLLAYETTLADLERLLARRKGP
jgi:cobalt-zinc-cadmium efflux system outer membrane protein